MVLYWLLAIDISIFSMRISAFSLVCFQVLVEFWLYLQLGRKKHAQVATENIGKLSFLQDPLSKYLEDTFSSTAGSDRFF